MNIQLLRNGILLHIPQEPPKTSGGILLIKESIRKPHEAIVALTGTGKNGDAVQCKVGDLILYNHHVAQTIEVDGIDYFYITENDLIAIK